jgi:hypothetical protein
MEIQGSLPRSQQPSIFPYPEPDKSPRRSPIPFNIYFNIILYIPRSFMPPVSLSFPHQTLVCIRPFPPYGPLWYYRPHNIQQYKSWSPPLGSFFFTDCCHFLHFGSKSQAIAHQCSVVGTYMHHPPACSETPVMCETKFHTHNKCYEVREWRKMRLTRRVAYYRVLQWQGEDVAPFTTSLHSRGWVFTRLAVTSPRRHRPMRLFA